MSFRKEYNNLPSKDKSSFLEFHAPLSLTVGQTLVRKFSALYNDRYGWLMPEASKFTDHLIMGSEETKVYTKFRYQALARNDIAWMQRQKNLGESFGDKRGGFVDMNGVEHRDVYRMGNYFYKLVDNISTELAFLNTLVTESVVPPVAIVEVKEVDEVKEVSDEDKALYKKYEAEKQKHTKKEFAKLNGISTHVLNRIIKSNEV